MKEFLPVLKRTRLFYGVGESEIEGMLGCFQASEYHFEKGEYVFREGEKIRSIAILVKGNLHIQKDDYWGNHSIVHIVSEGELFGEAYAVPDGGPIRNDVVAVEDSVVFFLDAMKILTVCQSACKFHAAVVKNLFSAVAERNRRLAQKISYMSQRTTREKLMAYLSEQSRQQGGASFDIPFNRQQLADFLSVDRSAMSNELCKMRDDGMIEFERNHFVLHCLRQ